MEGGSLEQGQLWALFREGIELSYPDGLQEEDWEELMGKMKITTNTYLTHCPIVQC